LPKKVYSNASLLQYSLGALAAAVGLKGVGKERLSPIPTTHGLAAGKNPEKAT